MVESVCLRKIAPPALSALLFLGCSITDQQMPQITREVDPSSAAGYVVVHDLEDARQQQAVIAKAEPDADADANGVVVVANRGKPNATANPRNEGVQTAVAESENAGRGTYQQVQSTAPAMAAASGVSRPTLSAHYGMMASATLSRSMGRTGAGYAATYPRAADPVATARPSAGSTTRAAHPLVAQAAPEAEAPVSVERTPVADQAPVEVEVAPEVVAKPAASKTQDLAKESFFDEPEQVVDAELEEEGMLADLSADALAPVIEPAPKVTPAETPAKEVAKDVQANPFQEQPAVASTREVQKVEENVVRPGEPISVASSNPGTAVEERNSGTTVDVSPEDQGFELPTRAQSVAKVQPKETASEQELADAAQDDWKSVTRMMAQNSGVAVPGPTGPHGEPAPVSQITPVPAAGYGPPAGYGHIATTPVYGASPIYGLDCPLPQRPVCGVMCDDWWGCDNVKWNAIRPIPWEVFAQGEYVGPSRLPHVPEYRLRVDDVIEFVYRLTATESATPYRFNVGDVLSIESLTAETVNREVIVQPDGSITLRQLGQVPAAGLTVEELRADLNERYRRYIMDPSITVTPIKLNTRLEEFRATVINRQVQGGQSREARVTPEGTVQLPAIGSVPAQGLTLEELGQEIEQRYAHVVHGLEVTPILTQRAPRYIYVLGEVKTPGRFTLEGPTTVMQAVALAGSWNNGAHLKQIVIFRRDENWRLMATKVDIRGALYGKRPCPSGEIWLRDSDVVVVPKSPILVADDFIELVFTRGIYGVVPFNVSVFKDLSSLGSL